ncbi:MAG: cyclic nucleotide-binding domain-containing protein [Desulfobacterales bacterium]|nr:cyclic nucleotide-binding domain-containing protein [Desulfobacterales bacterium]
MDYSLSIIRITKNQQCPYYKIGDEFVISGRGLLMSEGQPVCLTFMLDLINHLKTWDSNRESEWSASCSGDTSGCQGVIEFDYSKEEKQDNEIATDAVETEANKNIDAVVKLLKNFSIFSSLDEPNIKKFISFLKLKRFIKGNVILKKGEPGKNLYILLSGKVDVVDESDIPIATLNKGDVFGEMSLISGDPVGATIKAITNTTILYISGKNFSKILSRFPSVQMYFTKLLAQRLAKSNIVRAEDFASAMVGKLNEMPPAELFQTLNINRKTGIINMVLSKGEGKVIFNEGNIVDAFYNKKSGKDAFFDVLREREGRFKFVPGVSEEDKRGKILGNFMGLLMDGLRIIDEKNEVQKEDAIENLDEQDLFSENE